MGSSSRLPRCLLKSFIGCGCVQSNSFASSIIRAYERQCYESTRTRSWHDFAASKCLTEWPVALLTKLPSYMTNAPWSSTVLAGSNSVKLTCTGKIPRCHTRL